MCGAGRADVRDGRDRRGVGATAAVVLAAATLSVGAACGGDGGGRDAALASGALDRPEVREVVRAAARGDAHGVRRGLVARDPGVRRRAAQGSVGAEDPGLTDALIHALSDPDEGVRASAAFALGLRADAARVPDLRRALERESAPAVRAALIRAAGRAGGPSDGPWLVGLEGADRAAATEALARLALRGASTSGTVDALVARLGSPDDAEAAFAARGLVWSDAPDLWIRHRESIRGVLEDPADAAPAARVLLATFGRLLPRGQLEPWVVRPGDPRTRLAAVGALATHSDGVAGAPVLERALRDPHPWVRRAARRALAGLGVGPPGGDEPASRVPEADPGAGPPPPTWTAGEWLELAALGAAPHLVVHLDGGDSVTVALHVDEAPGAVVHLVRRVRAGRYDGVPIHRVVPGALLQWGRGGVEGRGTRPERSPRPVERGAVGLALDGAAGDDDLFVAFDRLPELDARHTLVGRVVDGWRALEAASTGTVIRRIRVVEAGLEAER